MPTLTHTPLKTALRWGLGLLAAAGLVLGCRGVVPTPEPTQPQLSMPAQVAGFPAARVKFRVKVDPRKPTSLSSPRFGVQFVDWNLASRAYLYVAGAGLNGWWQHMNGNNLAADASANFVQNATDQVTVVEFTGSVVPAGDRRVIRVEIRDGAGRTMDEYWNVIDIPATNVVQVVELTKYTTPTGRIFRDLFGTGDQTRVQAIPIADVQTMVDRLMDYDSQASPPVAFDGNGDGTTNVIDPHLLDTFPPAIAIANGTAASGPYHVPDVAEWTGDLKPVTPRNEATVVLKVFDSDGAPLATPVVAWVSDVVSPIKNATANAGTGELSPFFPVPIGSHYATVVDTGSGRRATVPISGLVDGETRVVSITMPFQGYDRLLGTVDLTNNQPRGFNGDRVHQSLAYVNDPTAIVHRASSNTMYWVELGNNRIRMLDLDDPRSPVISVAGASGPVSLNGNTSLAIDPAGHLIFSEYKAGPPVETRVAKIELDADGLPLTGEAAVRLDLAAIPDWPAGAQPGPLAVDAGHIYVAQAGGGTILDHDTGTGTTAKLTGAFSGGGLAARSGYVFYTSEQTINWMEGDPPVAKSASVNPLVRWDTAAATSVFVAADPDEYLKTRYTGLGELMDLGYSLPAKNVFPPSVFNNIAIDSTGNLYYTTLLPDGDKKSHTAWNLLMRISNVLDPNVAAPARPIEVSWLDVRGKLNMPKSQCNSGCPPLEEVLRGYAIGPVVGLTNSLLCTGRVGYPNPTGTGQVNVHGLYRIRP